MVALSSSPVPPDIHAWFRAELHPHESAVRNYVRRRFPGIADNEDIVQEAYLRLFRLYRRRQISNPRAMFMIIARNLAVDRLRHRGFRQRFEVDTAVAPEVPSAEPNVGELTAAADLSVLLGRAIEALDPRVRQVMDLQRHERLTQREIGRRLGLAEGTVGNLHKRGIAGCSEFFAKHGATLR